MRPVLFAFLLLSLASVSGHAQGLVAPTTSMIAATQEPRLAPAWPRYDVSRSVPSSVTKFVPTALTESQEKTLSTVGLVLLGALTLWLLTR